MSYSDTSNVVKVGDNVRVVYPKQKYRSPHRTDGLYEVEKIDPSQDIYWVKYLEEGSNKVTIVKRSYIQNVVNSKFKGLE
tara:strand:+ start:795 stop:1034 length:240 start_codon:yes stop_codon:yes gene_type:complete